MALTARLNPATLLKGCIKSDAFIYWGFPIPAKETFHIDIEASMKPDLVGDWRKQPAMTEYAAMANKLGLIYFESLPYILEAPVGPQVSQREVMTELVKALKPKGVMVLRMNLLVDHLRDLEGFLVDVKGTLEHFKDDAGQEKPYYVFRDTYDVCQDIRLVKA